MKKVLSLCLALAMVLTMGFANVTFAEDEQITLTYLNWNGGEEARLQQEAIDEYMAANPNIVIEAQWITEQYDAKINTMVAANELPDIYYINEYLAAEWGNKGVAAELGPIFADIGVDLDAEFVPTALFRDGERIFGVATGPVCGLLYYNRAMFDAKGLEYPSRDPFNPWTWEQYVEAARALTVDANGKSPGDEGFNAKQIRSYGTLATTFWLFFQPLLYSAGASYSNEDATGTGLDNSDAKRVIQAVADLILVEKVAPDAGMQQQFPGSSQAFNNMQLGMSISGTWEFQNFVNEGSDFGVAPLPSFDKPSNIAWAAANQIAEQSAHKEEAAKFLYFLINPDLNPRQLAINNPPTKIWYTDPERFATWTAGDAYTDDFRAVVPTIMTQIAVTPENVYLKNFFEVVGTITQQELDKVFAGDQTVDEAIENIKELSDGKWQGKW